MSAVPISRYLVQFGKAAASAPSAPNGGFGDSALDERFSAAELAEEPKEDVTEQIEAAYARGAAESRAAAEQEFVRKLLDLRINADARTAQERANWVTEQGNQLAEQIRAGFVELEVTLAASLERVIKPFIAAALRQQMVEALKVVLSNLLSDDRQQALRISGPQDLLDAIAAGLAASPRAVEYVPNDGVDVVVVADATIIESRLADWLAQLDMNVQ